LSEALVGITKAAFNRPMMMKECINYLLNGGDGDPAAGGALPA